MTAPIKVDICVIGAGSGGLTVAAGASQLGVSVALVERDLMGGDCLNYGCVPSKALLAAGKAAHNIETAGRFGISGGLLEVDTKAVRQHVRGVVAGIAPHDSVERFRALGVNVIQGAACFKGRREIEVDGQTITARRFVIATGSSPMVPPIPGLDSVDFLTNETLFNYDQAMAHLIVIGGGPIGAEMAQAHRRLGSAVTIIEMARLLPNDDPELASVVHDCLAGEGVDIRTGVKVESVAGTDDGVAVTLDNGDVVRGSHLLLAAGRKVNLDGLNLDAAGIDHSAKGITVDGGLRTTNRKVYAIGDVAGGLQFTHVAGHHAGVVIRNALFRLPARAKAMAMIPWVTYTDPELAHVGLREEAAKAQFGDINILRFPFAENDRAQAERDTKGMIKIVTAKGGKVLGVSMVGPHAGDLLQPWVMAVNQGLNIKAMAGTIWPYPTFGEVGHRAAGSYFLPKLFTDRTRMIVRFLTKFG
ncbi:MAG: FAD-dependent oxidoreductase [Rhodospirillaceae bacterium]|nr:FAD-dependent oxidoreductase [Rhodospirillaceae bacterium]MBT5195465.1 FAD-dependent oxidoreductase [Rhodospirillaceae bacterium]MBT5896119.1 FAD-dependent oxidoreductase [Rhodospirillaceae bacterium]MBT6428481.1 FAD-dependent oxidoreductase [Rhodospirillaceae bacterium]